MQEPKKNEDKDLPITQEDIDEIVRVCRETRRAYLAAGIGEPTLMFRAIIALADQLAAKKATS